MRSKIFLLSLTALLAASCNEISIPDHHPMSLDIDVRTTVQTKSLVTGSTLPSGSSVGLFVTDESGVTYDGVAVANVKYTGTGSGSSQVWTADEDIMLSATNANLTAYYPYSTSVSDISVIPIAASSTVQTDWMYATPLSNMNNKNYTATITMNHALTVVRFSFIRGSYSGTAEISSVSFSSDGAATSALLDATNGSLSSINGKGSEYLSTEPFNISDTQKVIDFITIPTGVSAPISIVVMMNGKKMTAEIPAVKLESGKIYEYTVAVGTEGIFLQMMNVNDWTYIDKGMLQLEPTNEQKPEQSESITFPVNITNGDNGQLGQDLYLFLTNYLQGSTVETPLDSYITITCEFGKLDTVMILTSQTIKLKGSTAYVILDISGSANVVLNEPSAF